MPGAANVSFEPKADVLLKYRRMVTLPPRLPPLTSRLKESLEIEPQPETKHERVICVETRVLEILNVSG